MLMLLAGASSAQAGSTTPVPDPPASASTSGHDIEIRVSGSGYTAGASGSGGGSTKWVPAPCWLEPWQTGTQYYEFAHSGRESSAYAGRAASYKPLPEYEDYKEDNKGRWYYPQCDMNNWPDQSDLAGFDAFSLSFHEQHKNDGSYFEYFPEAKPLPVPPVPAELLRDYAVQHLRVPDPELDWNPKIKGTQGTLVNLDTWFWLNNAPQSLNVRAEAGTSWANVTATFGGMDITAPGEKSVPCDGPGPAYVSGAQTTTCSLAFSRSSAGLGAEATPVTVKSRWSATWEGTGHAPEPITLQTAPEATVDIRVDEVQTLVTSAR
jgi:hypothetical protein